jgi:hypothetical protein
VSRTRVLFALCTAAAALASILGGGGTIWPPFG